MSQNLELTGLRHFYSIAYNEVTSLALCQIDFIEYYWLFCEKMSDLILRSVTFCTKCLGLQKPINSSFNIK